MFNNISALNFNNNQSTQSLSTKATTSENTSIFGNNILKDEKVKLTKEEKQAKKAAEKAERERIKNTPDGIIQGGKQGSNAGDCWLLAQMNSMSKTAWGKEALKNAITSNKDGSFTVHFEGIKKDINVSSDEFKKAQKNSYFSSGDADVLLLEVAVEKHFEDENINDGSIKGNDLAGEDSLQFLLTGAKGLQTTNEKYYEGILKLMGKNPEDNAGIAATYIYYDKTQGADGTNHAVSVQQVILDKKGDVKEVVLLDSYRPDTTYKKNYRQFVDELKVFGFTTPPKNKRNETSNKSEE